MCIPLIGKTESQLLRETRRARESGADLAEWRIDWYDRVSDLEALEQTGTALRRILGEMPLLMTFRTKEEGGAKAIETKRYQMLLLTLCEKHLADMIDVELLRGDELVKTIVEAAERTGVVVVGSNHDFDKTPEREEIIGRLCHMQALGVHMTKIAVMPREERDVLTLLDASLAMKEQYADRPFITMSMGKLGKISRMAGECFGSCLTFGTAGVSSAPGQMDTQKLNEILDLLHEA